ncbi:hypothetical protein H6G34_28825 [Anabaena variabilis FACHB-171]|nr:hypothetical protein [Trichormus variabilis FACHB-171]
MPLVTSRAVLIIVKQTEMMKITKIAEGSVRLMIFNVIGNQADGETGLEF